MQPVGFTLGTRKSFTTADLDDNKSLTQHTFIPVIEQRATSTRFYNHGYGENDSKTNVGRLGMDLKVADDDAGTNSADAKGIARPAIYPDDNFDVPKDYGDEYTLAELRDQMSLNARDRTLWPVQKKGASKDEYIVWEVKIDPSQEGMVVYQEGSDLSINFSEVKTSQA